MKYSLPLIVLLCSTLAVGESEAQVGGSSAVVKSQVGVNAAPHYRKAFAVMPKIDADQQKLLHPKSTAPIAARLALVAKAEPALKLCSEASRAAYCDWNFDLNEGGMLALPHLGLLQDLSRLALLKARSADARTAVELHEMVLRMGRHATTPPLLLGRLVHISIEAAAINSIAAMLPQWDEGLRNRVRSLVTNGLKPAPTVSECTLVEADFLRPWLLKILNEEVKKSGASFDGRAWLEKNIADGGTPFGELLKSIEQPRSSLPQDAAGVRRLFEDYRVQLQALARVLALPREAMTRESGQMLKAEFPRNVVFAASAPGFVKCRQHEFKLANMHALLLAAFEVQARGESALPRELATYHKTTHGFELTGKELFDGKPVILTVGSH